MTFILKWRSALLSYLFARPAIGDELKYTHKTIRLYNMEDCSTEAVQFSHTKHYQYNVTLEHTHVRRVEYFLKKNQSFALILEYIEIRHSPPCLYFH